MDCNLQLETRANDSVIAFRTAVNVFLMHNETASATDLACHVREMWSEIRRSVDEAITANTPAVEENRQKQHREAVAECLGELENNPDCGTCVEVLKRLERLIPFPPVVVLADMSDDVED